MNNILHFLKTGQQVSLSRFNDGEIGAIMGDLNKTSRGKQEVTESLVEKLRYALEYRSENYFIGIPCPICYTRYYAYTRGKLGTYPHQILCTATTNNHYNLFKNELLKLLEGKKVIYIGGHGITEINGWDYLKVQNHNSEECDYEILSGLARISNYDVYLLAIGAISRYLVAKLHEQGKTALDIGSLFDPETRNVYLKPHIWLSEYKNSQKYCPICNY